MIKKVLIFFTLIFINVNSHAYYDIDKKSGNIISGKLTIDSKTSIELGEGEWIIFNTESWFVNAIQQFTNLTLKQMKSCNGWKLMN